MVNNSAAVAALAALVLAGCTPGGAPTTPAATPPATSSASSAAPTPTRTGPVSLDVSTFEEASFSTASGILWCVLTAEGASCLIPRGYTGPAPTLAEPCPSWIEGDVRPNTLVLGAADAPEWVCLDDQVARPFKDDPSSTWQRGFGTWGRSDGDLVAVLPQGKKLKHGPYECLTDAAGVSCTNTKTGHGFRLAQKTATLT